MLRVREGAKKSIQSPHHMDASQTCCSTRTRDEAPKTLLKVHIAGQQSEIVHCANVETVYFRPVLIEMVQMTRQTKANRVSINYRFRMRRGAVISRIISLESQQKIVAIDSRKREVGNSAL